MAVSMETVLKLTAQVSGANNIQQVGNSLKNLSAVSQMSERTIDKLYIATKQYGQAAGNSVNSINQQINALTNLRNAVDPTSNRYKVLTKDLQAYERQLQSLNATQQRQQALHSAGGAAAGALMMGGGMQGALGAGAGALAMAGPGGMIAGAGLLAGGALIGTGVGNAMDVATQTRAISTLSDDAGGLTARIQDLVREQGYLTDRATAGAAAYEILSSGFSSTDDVLKILRASSEGAAGGFSDIKTVADAATSILNGYGMSAEQVTRVVDQMVVTQNDGKIKVNEYAQSIGRVIPTAAAAKISLEEINGAISALTAQGVPVESTFSGINQVIKSILKPTKEAADLSAALGLQFNGQALATKGLAGFLEDVSRKTGKSTDALSILFSDIDGYKAVVALLNDDLQRFNRFTDNQARSLNAAGVAARKAIDPVKQFDSAWKDFSATLGDLVLPAINATLQGATGLLQLLTSEQSGKALNNIFKLGSYSNLAGGGGIRELETAGLNGQLPAGASKPKAKPFVVPGIGTFDGETQRLIPGTAPVRIPTTATPPNVAAAIAKVRGTEPKSGSLAAQVAGALKSALDLTNAQSAGIVGNLMRESGLNPRVNEGGVVGLPRGVGGYGLAQWTGTRQSDLIRFAGSRAQAGDMETQLRFLVSEMRGPEVRSLDQLKTAQTPEQAAYLFDKHYERSGIKAMGERQSNARKVFGELSGGQIGFGLGDFAQQLQDQGKLIAEAQRQAARVRDLRSEADLRAALWENEKQSIQAEKDKDLVKKARLDGERKMLELVSKQAGIWAGDLPVQEKRLALGGGVAEMQRQSYRNVQDLASAQAETDKKRTEELTNQVKLIYEQADAAGILADETRRYSELAFGGRLPDSTFTTGMDLMGKNQQDSRIGMGAMDGISSWLDSVGTMRQSFQSLATDGIGGLTDALTELTTTGTTNFREFTAQILRDTTRIIIAQMVLRPLLGAIGGGGGGAFNPQITLPTAGPGWAPGFAEGGISTGPRSGYGAMLHGTEAIIPLSRGRAIPVEISGGGGGGGTAVTVNVDARGTQASGDNSRSEALGRDLSQVIDSRLAHHRRPGGLLA
jgi:TP901 family phage tail tape measure protein